MSCQPNTDEIKKENIDFDLKSNSSLQILNVKKQFKYDCIKQIYADLLFGWRLFEQRCSILNYVKEENNYQRSNQSKVGYSNRCSNCNELVNNNSQCKNCRKLVIECSVCHISVKGNYSKF